MVKYIAGSLLFLSSCTTVLAQEEHRQAQFSMAMPSQDNKAFFVQHPDIDHVVLNYLGNRAVHITLVSRVKNKNIMHHSSSLMDESAKANFVNQFGHFVTPDLPSANISFKSSIKDFLGEKNYYEVEALVKKDSIVYLFSLLKDSERNRPFVQEQQSHVARFIGDINLFDELLDKTYRLEGETITRDSIFNFYGFIQPDSTLTEIQTHSAYDNEISKMVVKELGRVGATKSWVPGSQLGHRGKKSIQFHVFLLPNGKISILTPRILRINEPTDDLE